MGIGSIGSRTSGSFGVTKANQAAITKPEKQLSASEYNRVADALIEVQQAIGTTVSPAVGTHEELINGLGSGELASALATRVGRFDGEVRRCSGVGALGVGTGTFRWHAGDVDAAVVGMVLGSGSGRWKRVYTRGSVQVEWFGAVGNWNGSAGTDNASAITAAIAWCEANKEQLRFGRGTFACGSTISVNGLSNHQWVGVSNFGDTTNVCSIVYTGPGISTRFVDARGTGAFAVSRLRIVAQPSSGSFTGKLVDLDGTEVAPTGFPVLDNIVLDIVGSTGVAVSLDNVYNARLSDVLVARCSIGVQGVSTGFSNAVILDNVLFALGTVAACCVKNPGKSWQIKNCAFEGLVNGSANGIWAEEPSFGLTVEGAWCGDTTGAVPGSWIRGSFFGAKFTANVFETYLNEEIVAIDLGYGSTGVNGVKIEANQFTGVKTAVAYSTATIGNVDQRGNSYTNVTNIRTGSPKSGRCDSLTPAGYSTGAVHEQFDALFARGQAGPQTIPDSTLTLVTLSDTIDRGGHLSGGLYAAPVAGWYRVSASLQLTQSTGTVQGHVGSPDASIVLLPEQRGAAAGVTRMGWAMSDIVHLNAGQQIGVYAYQVSGGARDLNYAHLAVQYVSS